MPSSSSSLASLKASHTGGSDTVSTPVHCSLGFCLRLVLRMCRDIFLSLPLRVRDAGAGTSAGACTGAGVGAGTFVCTGVGAGLRFGEVAVKVRNSVGLVRSKKCWHNSCDSACARVANIEVFRKARQRCQLLLGGLPLVVAPVLP